jgi:hypothetical protein
MRDFTNLTLNRAARQLAKVAVKVHAVEAQLGLNLLRNDGERELVPLLVSRTGVH